MATSRQTATNEQISTFGVARTYADWPSWESATDNDLVTAAASEVLECYDDAASFDTRVSINGATTDSSYFRIIRPASGEGHDGTSNNGITIIDTDTSNQSVDVTEDYFQIQDIILEKQANSGGGIYGVLLNGPDNCQIVGMIFVDGVNSGAGGCRGVGCLNTGGDTLIINNLIDNWDEKGFLIFNNNVYLYNNTCVDSGGNGFETATGSRLRNNLCDNSTGSDFTGGTSSPTQYNASSDATAPGSNSRTNQTFTFENAAGNDYHLDITDSGAKDFGEDLSAVSPGGFDDDIDFETRSGSWDMGFDEIPAVPFPVGTLPLVGVGR